MKKKIVINVPMHNDKAKSKAMKIAVTVPGVTSVSIGEGDRLEVIGEGVDSVSLANSLRKKFSFADIISLEGVEPVGPDSSPSPSLGVPSPPPSFPRPPLPQYWPPVYYESRIYDAPPPGCSLL